MFDEFRYDIKKREKDKTPKYILDSGHSYSQEHVCTNESSYLSEISNLYRNLSESLIVRRVRETYPSNIFAYYRQPSRSLFSHATLGTVRGMTESYTSWMDEMESEKLMDDYMGEVSYQLNVLREGLPAEEKIVISSSKDIDNINKFLKRKREVRQNDNFVNSRQVFSKNKNNNRRFTNGSKFFK